MAFNYSPKIVTDGLIFTVDAANKKSYPDSGTTWTDLAGSNNGTLINGPTFDSANGGVIDLDGTDDVVESSIDPSVFSTGYDAFTVSYWINYESLNNYNTVFELREGGSTTQWTDYNNINDANRLYSYPNGAVRISDSSLSVNTWYNISVAITQGSGNTFSTYINGQLDKTAGWNRNLGTVAKYRIGQNRAGTGVFNGQCSSISYYNRALSASEVLQNYNALKGRFGL